MRVQVLAINVPAYSTLGFGNGLDFNSGKPVKFCGDQRPMRGLGELLTRSRAPIEVELEDWQMLGTQREVIA